MSNKSILFIKLFFKIEQHFNTKFYKKGNLKDSVVLEAIMLNKKLYYRNQHVQIQSKIIPQKLKDSLKVYEQHHYMNSNLRASLKQISANLESKVIIQHQKMQIQRQSIVKALNFQKNMSLKQNFQLFANKIGQQKSNLIKRLKNLRQMNIQLQKNAKIYGEKLIHSTSVIQSIIEEKQSLKHDIDMLENDRQQKTGKKNLIPLIQISDKYYAKNHQLNQNNQTKVNFMSLTLVLQKQGLIISQNHQKQPFEQTQSYINNTQQLLIQHPTKGQHPTNVQNLINAQNVQFSSFMTKQLKSKQILKSLQRQLVPLRLDQEISKLQTQIETIENRKLSRLRQIKKKQSSYLKQNKQNMKRSSKILQGLKSNLIEFRQQRFKGNNV